MLATVERMDDAKLTRRGSLAGMAGLLLGFAGWKTAESEGAGPAAVASGAVACVLTPEQTEGPYYIGGEKYRRDITEGRPGVQAASSGRTPTASPASARSTRAGIRTGRCTST